MLASTYVLKFCNLKTNWGIKGKRMYIRSWAVLCVVCCVLCCVLWCVLRKKESHRRRETTQKKQLILRPQFKMAAFPSKSENLQYTGGAVSPDSFISRFPVVWENGCALPPPLRRFSGKSGHFKLRSWYHNCFVFVEVYNTLRFPVFYPPIEGSVWRNVLYSWTVVLLWMPY
jgi:hypothetical protein